MKNRRRHLPFISLFCKKKWFIVDSKWTYRFFSNIFCIFYPWNATFYFITMLEESGVCNKNGTACWITNFLLILHLREVNLKNKRIILKIIANIYLNVMFNLINKRINQQSNSLNFIDFAYISKLWREKNSFSIPWPRCSSSINQYTENSCSYAIWNGVQEFWQAELKIYFIPIETKETKMQLCSTVHSQCI